MDITLNWKNYNGGQEDSVKVYRATAPIDANNLPAPIATLPPGSTSYVDAGVARGSFFYYRTAIIKGTSVDVSENRAIRAIAAADTGPGPQTLSIGDWDTGYFGRVSYLDLISYGSLASFLGITAGSTLATDVAGEKGWIKVALNGKVLYVALSPARYNLTYNNLYQAGAVFGTKDNGPIVPTGATATNQYKPYVFNGNVTLIPRILKGLPDTTAALPGLDQTSPVSSKFLADPGKNEWDQLMGAFGGYARWTGDTAFAQLIGMNDEIGGITPPGSMYLFNFCQQPQAYAAGNALLRGGRSYVSTLSDFYPGAGYTIPVASASASSVKIFLDTAYGALYGAWRPVLELDI